jgi:3-oxoacyl-[acyl-carrier-protein] synthase-3
MRMQLTGTTPAEPTALTETPPAATAAPARTADATQLRPAAVLSVATALPAGRLTNAELADRLGVSENWIFTRTGVRERPVARPDERLADYAAQAGATALRRAGVPASEIDLVLVATMTQDQLTPNTAPLVAHALGATRAGAFDLGAACTAFLSGMAIGAGQIETGRATHVLLVGADFISRVTDYDDKRTAPLFGDAAGAVVLGPANGANGEIGPIVLGSDGSGAEVIQIDHVERKVRMDGPEVYRHAVARMSQVTLEAVARAGVTLDDIDLFVYHQANGRILRALATKLGIPPDRVVDCIESLGNSSAATLPLGLADAAATGRLAAGSRVLVSAFGAGFTWGGGVLQWDGKGDG